MEKLAEQWGLTPELVTTLTTYATRILGVLLVLVIALFVSKWAQVFVQRRLDKINFDATLTKFVGSVVRWAIMIFTILGCLGTFGIETTSFAAVIGGASLAIGLAFQGSLGNVAAGAMLLLFRPYKVGDSITVSGNTGKVDAIDLFTTTLDTADNRRLIVPNGAVFGSTIENKTYHDRRRADVTVGIGYGEDIDTTREVLENAVKDLEGVQEIQVYLTGLGASSVDWSVRCWCATTDYWAILETATRAVKNACDEHDLDIPYPHQVQINKQG
jgi:small conductance mechanosensitive channel